MFKIAKWYKNYNAPAVLMIDDLSDAYIDVYRESYKNDWGYLCNKEGSSYNYLRKNLLDKYPNIKITFFTPYLRHNVINEYCKYNYKKYAVGEREEFTSFLKGLVVDGHEIAHHGSNHGKYLDIRRCTTVNNWIHEWALFEDIETGIKVTLDGVKIFKETCGIDLVGGKYCGYITRENSQKIIDKCNFLYWCDKPSYNTNNFDESFFGKNNIVSFPTNYAGNSFVRLTYVSGDTRRDRKKFFFKYFQPLYDIYCYMNLYKLYKKQQIISIQEHYSPSTTAGTVQSANIVTDIKSLNKIFSFLSNLSIWYANCKNISEYIYIRDNSKLRILDNKLEIYFNNQKNITNPIVSIVSQQSFRLKQGDNLLVSIENNGMHVVNVSLDNYLTTCLIYNDLNI